MGDILSRILGVFEGRRIHLPHSNDGIRPTSDISVDLHVATSHLRVYLKCSKTDPFGAGFTLHLGCTKDVCPVAATLSHLACRQHDEGFLFKFKDGKPLSHDCFCHELGLALQEVGVDTSGCSGHSFRIGVASSVASTFEVVRPGSGCGLVLL